MEPGASLPQFNPERTPAHYSPSVEQVPDMSNLEKGFDGTGERREVAPQAEQVTDQVLPQVVSLPQPATPVSLVANDALIVSNDAPLVASDDDLIEKEWVDKAKKIIAETRNDPRKLEAQVGTLQRDYLRKRYGREVGAAD